MANADADPPDESSSASEVVIGGRFRVLWDSPIPALDHPGAKAYVARDLKNASRTMFVRVADPKVYPRVEAMVQLKSLRDVRLMPAIDWSPVNWPPEAQRCFAVVFDRPECDPVMPTLHDRIEPMHTELLVRSILTPAAETIAQMTRRGKTHRAIRPDNMFLEPGGKILLGECVSTPPGWGQSVVLETIEMGMTPVWARGAGSAADDIYALGVSLLFFALGFCPVADMKPEELIAAKIDRGSFVALLNAAHSPLGLREPLRGMLADDPEERWTVEEIDQWLGGALRRPAKTTRSHRSERPFEFMGLEFRNTRNVAHAFASNWSAASQAVQDIAFARWLQRGIDDDVLVERVEEILSAAGASTNAVQEDRNLSQICMLLDPSGPLRYKGLIANPDGLGSALSAAIDEGDDGKVQLIGECIGRGLPNDYHDMRFEFDGEDVSVALKTFRRLQQFLKHAGPGYGIERCLHEMLPFMPCKAKMLDRAYVYSLEDLLPALETIVRRDGELAMLIDRHVLAFIGARLKGHNERQFAALEDGKGSSVAAKLAMTGLLAMVQQEHGPERLPHLTRWLAGELAPAAKQFHSRTLREEINRKLDGIAASGKLGALFNHLNNSNQVRRDSAKHNGATREYANAAARIVELESERFQESARRAGWRIASAISTTIAFTTIVTLVLW